MIPLSYIPDCYAMVWFASSVLFSKGYTIEISRPAEYSYVDVSDYGVKIDSCAGTVFQAKGCSGVYLLLGDGTGQGSYEIFIGAHGDTKTGYRPCTKCWSSNQLFSAENSLECEEFRTFWIMWDDDSLVVGKGVSAGSGVMFNSTPSVRHHITVLKVSSYPDATAVFRFGEEHRSLFKLISEMGKATGGMMMEKQLSFPACAYECHRQNECGRFSYNSALRTCALFVRSSSSLSERAGRGWKTWQLNYCLQIE